MAYGPSLEPGATDTVANHIRLAAFTGAVSRSTAIQQLNDPAALSLRDECRDHFTVGLAVRPLAVAGRRMAIVIEPVEILAGIGLGHDGKARAVPGVIEPALCLAGV